MSIQKPSSHFVAPARPPGTARSGRATPLLLAAALILVAGCSDGGPSGGETAVAGAAEAASPREVAEEELEVTAGDWSVMERPRPDEGREVILGRTASRGANSMGIAPTLYLSCRDGRTKLSIAWYEDPEGNHNDVTTRIDDGREVRRTWRNEAGEASVFPEDSTTAFVADLLEADSLTVETNLYKRMPVTAVFRIEGLAEEIDPLREACGW